MAFPVSPRRVGGQWGGGALWPPWGLASQAWQLRSQLLCEDSMTSLVRPHVFSDHSLPTPFASRWAFIIIIVIVIAIGSVIPTVTSHKTSPILRETSALVHWVIGQYDSFPGTGRKKYLILETSKI